MSLFWWELIVTSLNNEMQGSEVVCSRLSHNVIPSSLTLLLTQPPRNSRIKPKI
jgi:hypothetical protein